MENVNTADQAVSVPGAAITKAQWKEVEAELASGHGIVKLLVDGYNLTYRVEMVSKLKLGIVTYVNGEWRGEWLREASEEGRRFFYHSSKFSWSPKHRAEMIKIYGGKRCSKADRARIEQKFVVLNMVWPSASLLRRHLVKNNTHIALVQIGYGAPATAAVETDEAF